MTGESMVVPDVHTDARLHEAPALPVSPLASTAALRERCPACSRAVAADQRYCVECGQRLAAARRLFQYPRSAEASTQPAPPPRRRRPRLSPDAALIAGVATLLLALGVGVLIGHAGQSVRRAAAPTVELLGGTGATGVAAGGEREAGSGGSPKPAGTAAPSGGSAGAGSTKPTKAAAPPPNPTVQVGQKGSGPGYHKGRFTGGFFGSEAEEEGTTEGEGIKSEEGEGSGEGGKGEHNAKQGGASGGRGR